MININFKWIIISLAVLGLFLGTYFMGRRSKNDEVDSYKNIVRTEQQKTKVFQDNAGYWHSKSETAELKTTEALSYMAKYDERFASLSKDFEDVRKDLKNVHYVGFTGTESNYTIHTSSKDTLYVMGHDTAHARYFNYKDSTGWFQANGIMLMSGQVPFLHFQCRDSLVTVITRNRRIFRKAIFHQEIKSCNPYTKVSYNESVLVNKRKKFLGIF